MVSVNQWSAYRARANFAEPDQFRPERWLDHGNDTFSSDHKDALQPFSTGPRNCLGKKYVTIRLQEFLGF